MSEKILVDGANVAYEEQSEAGAPKVTNLTKMRDLLKKQGYDPLIVVDASLRYDIDDPQQLEALFDDRTVYQAPADTDADYFVLELARENRAKVVSNDQYDAYRERFSEVLQRRVPFMIVNGHIELYQPHGPDG